MADPTAQKPKNRRPPLENRNRTWLGIIAIAVVSVLIGALLIVKVADIGYRTYTARFAQAAALKSGNPITVAGIPVGEKYRNAIGGPHEAHYSRSVAYECISLYDERFLRPHKVVYGTAMNLVGLKYKVVFDPDGIEIFRPRNAAKAEAVDNSIDFLDEIRIDQSVIAGLFFKHHLPPLQRFLREQSMDAKSFAISDSNSINSPDLG